MTETEIEPVETVLGRLQRGRGSGYLDALSEDAVSAQQDVIKCVTKDPRWDSQVEARSTYYANLMIALNLGIDPLVTHLFNDKDYVDDDENRTGLTLNVLGDLARRGRPDATPVLRRYVATGRNWVWGLHELMALESPEAVEKLDDVIGLRFAGDADLVEALRQANVPQGKWPATNVRVVRALDAIANEEERGHDREAPVYPPIEPTVVAALHGSEAERREALISLGNLRSPLVVDAAEAAIRSGSPDLRRVGRRALFRARESGMVERARLWATESNELSEAALHVLARHGTAVDIPFLREQLTQGWAQRHMYQTSDAVEGLGRLADASSSNAIETIYLETTYSYLRRRAAQALAAVSASFAETQAIESLWDCETVTRAVGCACATWSQAMVRDRIRELVADTLEDDVVRPTGRARLNILDANGKDAAS